ncbi:hypothetical protein J6590_001905 [Homalodisca vitripennis]|nr:hypothetical protein J6590_001905 [Homalodisca vitripennis]
METFQDMRTPWRKILTSGPVWAVHASSFGYLWSYWTFVTMLPNYFSHVLGFDIKNNGLIASLPYLLKCFLILAISWITDFTTSRNIIPLGVSRKIWNSVALWGGAAALLCLPIIDSVPGATILLTAAVASGGGVFCGYLTNPLDIAPNFSGVVMGITTSIGNINAILGPLVTGFIVQDESSRDQWMVAFYICAATAFAGNLIFVVWGSSRVQPWNAAP